MAEFGTVFSPKGYLFSSSSPVDTVISSSNGIRIASPVFLLTTSPYVTGGVHRLLQQTIKQHPA